MHTMTLVDTVDGWEWWECEDCPRVLHVRWQPKFRRVVIVKGDEQVSHSGGKGGVVMGKVEVKQ